MPGTDPTAGRSGHRTLHIWAFGPSRETPPLPLAGFRRSIGPASGKCGGLARRTMSPKAKKPGSFSGLFVLPVAIVVMVIIGPVIIGVRSVNRRIIARTVIAVVSGAVIGAVCAIGAGSERACREAKRQARSETARFSLWRRHRGGANRNHRGQNC